MTNLQDPSAASSGQASDRSTELAAMILGMADATLYRTNAFRLVGAPVHATAREIARRFERRKLAHQVGTAVAAAAGPLALDPPPDAATVHQAVHRIHDPERRLIEELFWFWPVDDTQGPDPALEALERGDTTTAIAIWRGNDSDGIGVHNLAVLFHALALDLESLPQSLARDPQRRRDRCWRESFAHWQQTIDREQFWSRLTQRIRELDDPRLTTGTTRSIRASLPTALLCISARLAISAAERGADEDSARHAGLIEESGLGADAAERALETILEPIRQRVLTLCRVAEPAASADPANAHRIAEQLLDQTTPLLDSLTFLRDGHPMRESAHDEVAHCALACQITYGNKTQDWETSLRLLTCVLAVCSSASARARVESNLQVVKENVAFARESGRCWFCGTANAVESAAVEVKLHGNERRVQEWDGERLLWNTLTVKGPRCGTCKTTQSRATGWAVVIFIVSTAMGFISSGAGPEDAGAAVVGFGGLIAGGIAAAVTHNFLMGGVKPSGAAPSFPAVKRKLDEGWKLGEKPEGAQ